MMTYQWYMRQAWVIQLWPYKITVVSEEQILSFNDLRAANGGRRYEVTVRGGHYTIAIIKNSSKPDGSCNIRSLEIC